MEHTIDSKKEVDIIRGLSFGGLLVSTLVFIPAIFFYFLVIFVIVYFSLHVLGALSTIEIPVLYEQFFQNYIGFSKVFMALKVIGYFIWLVLWAILPVLHITSIVFGWVNFKREKYKKALKICLIPILLAMILATSSSIVLGL